jgi:predicted enzyme related to lactoylglutathione lyase
MQNLGVAFIMYPVADLARSVAYYSDVLGLRKAGLDSDFWVEFEIGATTFGIGNFPEAGAPGSAQSLAIEVADLAAARAELASRGFASTEPYHFPNCAMSVTSDPDGNQIRLHQIKTQ